MLRDGITVLGIDAAWTDGQPSGVRTPQVVAVDMPLSTQPIVGRRAADTEVSRRFGHRNCSTHSPNVERPGPVGRRLYDAFIHRKFRLATAGPVVGPSLLEVYPHPALLGLMQVERRVPYKVSKRGTYWPDQPSAVRKRLLVEQWRLILAELRAQIDGIELPLPERPEEQEFAALKPFEGTLDALICAWVGIEFAEGTAVPLGNATAAIWVPSSSMSFAKTDAA